MAKQMTMGVIVGNRGFFPSHLATSGRLEMIAALERSKPAYAIVYGWATNIDGIPYTLALPEPTAYLQEHYAADRQFGAIYVLRRK